MDTHLTKSWGLERWVTGHRSPQARRWDQDKRKNGSNKRTMKQKGCRPNPPPPPTPHHKGLWWHTNPILPSLQSNWINSLALVLIFTQKATPEVETHTYARKRVFTSNWSELRPVSREQALGIEMPCWCPCVRDNNMEVKIKFRLNFFNEVDFQFPLPPSHRQRRLRINFG